ncbi:elongation factor P [Eubacteriales bacterium OttesenSCG-928-N14]|nr:elongation factor P [Eubacteriales bacterium OttesenSCG-928-N14]
MVSAGEFRKGMTIELDGEVWVVVDFQHVKPGKGAAFVRTKIKNVMTGGVLEKTFNPTERVPKAHVESKDMQFLYEDGGLYYFMDMETYEQLPLSKDLVEDAMLYVKENTNATVKFFKDQAFSVEPPNFVELVITQTDPGFKGDTAQAGTKPATLETGAVVQVPLFISEGETVRVDTRTGEYMSRA